MDPKFYYAREAIPEGLGWRQTYVRFTRKQNRDLWVKGDPSRFVVWLNDRGLREFLSKSPTWEYIDGVSWGHA